MIQNKKVLQILLTCWSLCGTSAQEDPLAETSVGSFRGFWSISHRGNNMATFIGIPYAKPPVSKL